MISDSQDYVAMLGWLTLSYKGEKNKHAAKISIVKPGSSRTYFQTYCPLTPNLGLPILQFMSSTNIGIVVGPSTPTQHLRLSETEKELWAQLSVYPETEASSQIQEIGSPKHDPWPPQWLGGIYLTGKREIMMWLLATISVIEITGKNSPQQSSLS
jgi:hypothetical protein